MSERGLVALGDSITNGEGAPMLGVRAWSWAQWVATALELPYTGVAENGARVPDVEARQLPRLDGPYAVACLYAGVNDVRNPDFDEDAYAAGLARIAERVASTAARVVMPTIPLDLGRPRAGAKVAGANVVIADVAAQAGALVVDLSAWRDWRRVLPDSVHLTALGQLELAQMAAEALAHAGAPVRRMPLALADVDRSAVGAARYAVTGHAAALARDLRRRALERVRR